MHLTVEIPDDIAGRLSAQGGGDLSRRARESFLAEEYRRDRLTKSGLQQLLGIETRHELDAFLEAHDISVECAPHIGESESNSLEANKGLTGADLIAAIQRSPYREVDIEPKRYRLPVSDVAF